jgi:Holliday junction resolvase-like predicted endonuclease
MPAQRDILIALLEKTRKTPVDNCTLRESLRVTDEAYDTYMTHLTSNGLIDEEQGNITASLNQRLELAIKAIQAGGDLERVSRALGWLEFEEIVARIFEENGYDVKRRFRFQAEGRRWEIDILATRRPLIVCAECKHWAKGLGSATARRIAETHLEKVETLSRSLGGLRDRIGIHSWNHVTLIPMALSLQPARERIYRRIPVVSVYGLPGFLSEYEAQMDWLASFPVDLT